MKLRNLFLAGIAAFAMASCSNENNEIINNGDNGVVGTEDASFQFGIAFANTASSGVREVGIPSVEDNFTDATVVIEQASGKSVHTFVKDEFSTTDNKLWLKEKIGVESGDAKIFVFLNASDALKRSLQETATDQYNTLIASVAFADGIDALTKNNIATANKFLMSNTSGTAIVEKFTKGETKGVTVPVSRVAAKLVEKTNKTTAYPVANKYDNPRGYKISVNITDFSYAGLAQNTSIMNGGIVSEINLFKAFDSTSDFAYQATTDASGVTNYCMENKIGTNLQTTTNIIYKGLISIKDAKNQVVTIDGAVYITADNKLFTSINDLKEGGYNYNGLTETSTIKECLEKFGLKKYVNGECYYVGQIKTNASNKAEIVRNNIYNLSVSSIKEIGTNLPKTDEKFTLLDLTVDITPWTVNINAFDL
ncbi:Mfa1 family fimbria major subunit [Bacteroides faecalis]|uniref:Minor fimbrium subunit Mfa1 C-terminal domain-containing protein n=1 Tax=Bacteroides faecalis TaxID=2447885 RepID=A0A401LRS4_9BACE|nr:Mfa1 family fimbria major subunit [Bacteroides faecalis]GCB34189.1 hypothetical protein KGMB02408_11340 [Bacteroides faecalis]